jgi:type II secretory pathway pseudopilin PulG
VKIFNINNKKGAMFGLDARIALAIFGSLSVISGAALYSAIQTSQVTQIISQLKEIEKAVQQRYLDTGRHMRLAGPHKFEIEDLFVGDRTKGWEGPYLPLEYEVPSKVFFLDSYGTVSLWSNDDWGLDSVVAPGEDIYCDAGEDCSIWISIYTLKKDLAEEIDIYVDGELSEKTGKIRLYESGSDHYHVWIQTSIQYDI